MGLPSSIAEGAPARGVQRGRVDGVRKIAVVRANALGDLVFALPALDALRAAYPGAEIVLLGKPWHEAFLAGRPAPIDRVVVLPPLRGVGAPEAHEDDAGELQRFIERVRAERFDLAIQLHGGGRHSNRLVRRLGARVTAGARAADADPLDRWTSYVYFQNEVLRNLEVVSLVGAAPVTIEPRLAVTARDREEAERALPDDGRPPVVLHPGATDGRRRWPAPAFAALAGRLAADGRRVAVTGTPEEAALVAAVARDAPGPVENLCGRLSLHALVGLLDRAALVVSNDTGPLHVARAVGTPTVGIYWCGNFVNGGPLTRTFHRTAISWRMQCPVCGVHCLRGSCEHDASFVEDVSIEDVLDPALALLEGARGALRAEVAPPLVPVTGAGASEGAETGMSGVAAG